MRTYTTNIILFFLTIITTTFAGIAMSYKGELNWVLVANGFSFSLSLMFILGVHELAHYFTSTSHKVDATLPYFIPFPSLIGTFGAFIRIKSPIKDKKSLLDIGISGPGASFLLSIPIFLIGLKLSRPYPVSELPHAVLRLGDSIITWSLTKLVFPNISEGYDIIIHPMAFAGWIGFFATSINLLPISQLDGGHIAYAILGRRIHAIISRILVLLLIPLGFLWPGWLLWALLIVLFIRLDHPAPLEPYSILDNKRKILGGLALLILILTFLPAPFRE